MEVSIFDPKASVIFVNSAGSSAENTVMVSLSIPTLDEMKLKTISQGGNVADAEGTWALVNVEIEDPAYTSGDAVEYSENANCLCTEEFEVPNLTKDDLDANYAGIQLDVYCISEDGTATAKAKSRKLSKDNSVNIG